MSNNINNNINNNRKLRIAVIFGGRSPEHGVSLESASAVLAGLSHGSNREKYEVVPVGISRTGEWFLYRGELEQIAADCWQAADSAICARAWLDFCPEAPGLLWVEANNIEANNINNNINKVALDGALPVLHGQNGEDGSVQGALQLAGLPVIGCGVLASALCMDKLRAHQLAEAAGVPVARARVISRPEQGEAAAAELTAAAGWPLFVKPLRAGSSFGISRVAVPEQLAAALEAAFGYDSQVIIEEAIPGREVGCAVLGNPDSGGTDGELILGEPDEIELAGDCRNFEGFFDYTEKYTLQTSAIHVPARLEPELRRRIRQTAAVIYRALGCSGFARVDMFVTVAGKLYFNEVNTIPGFTAHSRFPNMLKAAGWSFEQVLDKAVQLGLGYN